MQIDLGLAAARNAQEQMRPKRFAILADSRNGGGLLAGQTGVTSVPATGACSAAFRLRARSALPACFPGRAQARRQRAHHHLPQRMVIVGARKLKQLQVGLAETGAVAQHLRHALQPRRRYIRSAGALDDHPDRGPVAERHEHAPADVFTVDVVAAIIEQRGDRHVQSDASDVGTGAPRTVPL